MANFICIRTINKKKKENIKTSAWNKTNNAIMMSRQQAAAAATRNQINNSYAMLAANVQSNVFIKATKEEQQIQQLTLPKSQKQGLQLEKAKYYLGPSLRINLN